MKYINSLLIILKHPLNYNRIFCTLLRIFWWKINQLYIKIPAVVEMIDGVKCICYPNSSYGGLVVYTRLPEYHEMKFILSKLKKFDTFIDVGANIGVFSLLAVSKIENGKVYSFEPNEVAGTIFRENIRLNDFSKVINHDERIVSDKNGSEYFTLTKHSEVSHISYKKSSVKDHNKRIKSIKLDSFCEKNKIKKVRILKIDVEGAEKKVLKGSESLIKDNLIDYILFESNIDSKEYGYESEETKDFLMKYGYDLYEFNKKGKLIKHKISNGERLVENLVAVSPKAKQ